MAVLAGGPLTTADRVTDWVTADGGLVTMALHGTMGGDDATVILEYQPAASKTASPKAAIRRTTTESVEAWMGAGQIRARLVGGDSTTSLEVHVNAATHSV